MKKCFILSLTGLTVLAINFLIIHGCATINSLQYDCNSRLTYSGDADQKAFWPDKGLKKAFCRYWRLRYTGKISEAYQMEAPQFRNEHNERHYRTYVKRTPEYTWLDAILDSLTEKKSGVTIISGTWVLQDSGEELIDSVLRDRWIKEKDGKWYHCLYNAVFFPVKYGNDNKNEESIKNHNIETSKGGESEGSEPSIELEDIQPNESKRESCD